MTYQNDLALEKKVKEGWFTEAGERYLPVENFPAPPPHMGYWPNILSSWCKKKGVVLRSVDALTVSATVSKEQIQDFIDYVYGRDASYNDPSKMLSWKGRAYLANALTNLRAVVAQELDPALWYELNADEY